MGIVLAEGIMGSQMEDISAKELQHNRALPSTADPTLVVTPG